MTQTTAIPEAKCLACGHQWVKRKAVVRACPRCKSYTWNQPRKPKPGAKS